jgi:hypothetical protein
MLSSFVVQPQICDPPTSVYPGLGLLVCASRFRVIYVFFQQNTSFMFMFTYLIHLKHVCVWGWEFNLYIFNERKTTFVELIEWHFLLDLWKTPSCHLGFYSFPTPPFRFPNLLVNSFSTQYWIIYLSFTKHFSITISLGMSVLACHF